MKFDRYQMQFVGLVENPTIMCYRPLFPTKKELSHIFEILNRECFEGRLFEPQIVIADLSHLRAWGTFEEPQWIPDGTGHPYYIEKYGRASISIDYSLKGWDLCETMFHEMIHYFQHASARHSIDSPHGPLFKYDYDKRIEAARKAYFEGKINLDK